MEEKEAKRHRVVADIKPELIKAMKLSALLRGMTIKQWLEVAIKMLVDHDKR